MTCPRHLQRIVADTASGGLPVDVTAQLDFPRVLDALRINVLIAIASAQKIVIAGH